MVQVESPPEEGWRYSSSMRPSTSRHLNRRTQSYSQAPFQFMHATLLEIGSRLTGLPGHPQTMQNDEFLGSGLRFWAIIVAYFWGPCDGSFINRPQLATILGPSRVQFAAPCLAHGDTPDGDVLRRSRQPTPVIEAGCFRGHLFSAG